MSDSPIFEFPLQNESVGAANDFRADRSTGLLRRSGRGAGTIFLDRHGAVREL